jgi:aspartate kinase
MKVPGIQIQKYGGSSLATPVQLIRVAGLVRESLRVSRSAVVVVSAMGKTTDELLALAEAVGDPAEPDRRELDQLLATGETASAALLAMALRRQGVPAISLTAAQAGIRVTGEHGRAIVAGVDTDRIRWLVDAGSVVVVAGFQGIAANGDIMTLGRGGSDTTAVAMASALGQNVCHIYTDVDGVFTSDPRVVPAARRLPTMDLDVLIELAHAGAQVVHTRAAELAAARSVDLHVASTFANGAGNGGTLTRPSEAPLEQDGGIVAVAGDQNVAQVYVTPAGPSLVAGVFRVLGAHAVPIDLVGKHPGGLSFTVARAEAVSVRSFLAPIVAATRARLDVNERLAKISVVGHRLLGAAAPLARMLSVLAEHDISVESLATSQSRISALIQLDALQTASNALHAEFGLGGHVEFNSSLEPAISR